MDLQNDRVYPTRDIETWLSVCAGLRRGSRAWNQALKAARQTVFEKDVYFFERISDTHYRVHRADAEGVQNIFRILNDATSSRSQGLQLIVLTSFCLILCAAGAIGLVSTLSAIFSSTPVSTVGIRFQSTARVTEAFNATRSSAAAKRWSVACCCPQRPPRAQSRLHPRAAG